MRSHYEFSLYPIAAEHVRDGVDPTLALMGSQGWELRGIAATPQGGIILALQRPFDDEKPLPDASTLAATLDAPVTPPTSEPGSDQYRGVDSF
jgi:hypothetical protein